ncbi:MAG: ribonuclease H-like domain-containing protein [Aeoliella sp.]
MENPDRIPASYRAVMVEESVRCLAALENGDVQYFVDRFVAQDKWRVLGHYFDDATFFDIETLGLSSADSITVIVSWSRSEFQVFVEHENLDDFLPLLDDTLLLVSFNGSTFDVPRVLDTFHIPDLPCPHLDLRWTTYHRGLAGGLKEIARRLGINRPEDLRDISGAQAILLWQAWMSNQDHTAREHLIRYCAADVLLLFLVAHRLVGKQVLDMGSLWEALPTASGFPDALRKLPPSLLAPSLAPIKRRQGRNRSLLSKRWASKSA